MHHSPALSSPVHGMHNSTGTLCHASSAFVLYGASPRANTLSTSRLSGPRFASPNDVVVGFGDWKGGGRRRWHKKNGGAALPLAAIRRRLGQFFPSTALKIPEAFTSALCHSPSVPGQEPCSCTLCSPDVQHRRKRTPLSLSLWRTARRPAVSQAVKHAQRDALRERAALRRTKLDKRRSEQIMDKFAEHVSAGQQRRQRSGHVVDAASHAYHTLSAAVAAFGPPPNSAAATAKQQAAHRLAAQQQAAELSRVALAKSLDATERPDPMTLAVAHRRGAAAAAAWSAAEAAASSVAPRSHWRTGGKHGGRKRRAGGGAAVAVVAQQSSGAGGSLSRSRRKRLLGTSVWGQICNNARSMWRWATTRGGEVYEKDDWRRKGCAKGCSNTNHDGELPVVGRDPNACMGMMRIVNAVRTDGPAARPLVMRQTSEGDTERKRIRNVNAAEARRQQAAAATQ